MNYIYENILKPLLKIMERFFVPKNSKEFVVIINILDLLYEKGGNLLNNLFFIILFPILYFPLINFVFFVIGGAVITILDIIFAIFPIVEKGALVNFVTYGYFIEIVFLLWNLFLFGHYTFSGMLKVRYDQTKRFFIKPFNVSYKSDEYAKAYKKFRENIK
tara:strand:- start:327 stop:809 length:483 start_codon:yes stop_codon:yes gene_type:complete